MKPSWSHCGSGLSDQDKADLCVDEIQVRQDGVLLGPEVWQPVEDGLIFQ